MILRVIVLPFALLLAAPVALAEDAAGKWDGALHRSEPPVPVTLSITRAAGGALTGTAEAPSGAVALEKITSDGAQLTFDLPGPVHCKLHWDETAKAWIGVMTQNGVDIPLELRRAN